MDSSLDAAVATVKDRHERKKRGRSTRASVPGPVRQADNLSTELQFMVAWGILHASAAASLARKQESDYEVLGVPVPDDLRKMARVGKSGELTSHSRRDFFRKFKPLPWLPTPVPAKVVAKGRRGSSARYPFITVVPVLMVNELFDAFYHYARDVFLQLRGNLEQFWDQVRLNSFWNARFFGGGLSSCSRVFLYSPSALLNK